MTPGDAPTVAPYKAGHLPAADAVSHLHLTIQDRKDKNARIRNLIYYLVFLVTFVVIVVMQRDIIASKSITDAVDDAIFEEEFSGANFDKNFHDIGALDEAWEWLEGPFAEALSNTEYYEGYTQTDAPIVGTHRILMQNYQLGSVRVRTVRVGENTCNAPDSIKAITGDICTGIFGNESTEKFVGNGALNMEFKDASETEARRFTSQFDSHTFPRSGYFFDISSTEDIAAVIATYKAGGFLDDKTRLVDITMNMVNSNLRNAVVVHAYLEVTSAGLIYPSTEFKSMRINHYSTSTDGFRAFLEVIFVVMLGYFMFSELKEIRTTWKMNKSVKPYFSSLWNCGDILNLILFTYVLIVYLVFMLASQRTTEYDASNTGEFVSLDFVVSVYENMFSVISFNILISAFRVFRYLTFNPRISLLWDTLDRAKGDLIIFMLFFSLLVGGFALAGHFMFGAHLDAYKSLGSSFSSVLQIALGGGEYDDLKSVSRLIAPIYYTLITFIVVLTAMSIVLAIIADSYAEANESVKESQVDLVDRDIMRGLSKSVAKAKQRYLLVREKTRRRVSGVNNLDKIAAIKSSVVSHGKILKKCLDLSGKDLTDRWVQGTPASVRLLMGEGFNPLEINTIVEIINSEVNFQEIQHAKEHAKHAESDAIIQRWKRAAEDSTGLGFSNVVGSIMPPRTAKESIEMKEVSKPEAPKPNFAKKFSALKASGPATDSIQAAPTPAGGLSAEQSSELMALLYRLDAKVDSLEGRIASMSNGSAATGSGPASHIGDDNRV